MPAWNADEHKIQARAVKGKRWSPAQIVFLGLSLLFNETTPRNLGVFCGLRRSFWAKDLKKKFEPIATRVNHSNIKTA